MNDYVWSLNGYEFGIDRPVRVAAFRPGTQNWRTQDVMLPGQAGHLVGRDTQGATTWAFDLLVKAGAGTPALDASQGFMFAWAAAHRRGPGELSVLSYGLPGRPRRRVYGRPGEATLADVRRLLFVASAPLVADFVLADPLTYADTEQSLSLELSQPTDGGAVWPVTWPVTWGASTVTRQGLVFVEGDAPTPFRLVVDGPVTGQCSDITVTGPGWAVDVPGPVAFDEQLVVDTRAMTVTVGGKHGVTLSRRSRLDARLETGQSEVTFSCTDDTGTARAHLSWRPAWYSL